MKKLLLLLILVQLLPAQLLAVPPKMDPRSLDSRGLDPRNLDSKLVPGFKTSHPKETSLNDHHALSVATERVFNKDEHSQHLKQVAETRPYFVIDLAKDPIVKNSTAAVQDPERVLSSDLYNRRPITKYAVKTCQESKPSTEFKCSKTLLSMEVHIDPAKYSNWWCRVNRHRPDDPKCKAKKYYNPPKMYEPERIYTTNESWASTCQTLEARAKRGICRLVKQVCPKGPETREVKGTIGNDRRPTIHQYWRSCWRYEHIYVCSHPSTNNCESLRKASCEQIDSECLKKIDGTCVEWKQTYRCPTGQCSTGRCPTMIKENKELVSSGKYCLPKGGTTVTHTPNKDMNEAIAKLSIFQEMQDDIRKTPSGPIRVFKGQDRRCTIAFGKFKNCCTNGKGWGVSLGWSQCSGEERDLAEREKKRLCVQIGTYCAQKLPVIGCIRKKRTHCCFPTKLSRILQEQGRKQLHIGWGSPENPQCRGFTPGQLSRLDFDRLDLREIFTEIASRVKQTTTNVVKRNLSDRVSQMTHGFKNQPDSGDH